MEILHEILRMEPLDGFRIRVEFDTGETGVFDCSPYIGHPAWNRLADPSFFALVTIRNGTLAWPDDIDIAPEDIWEDTVRDGQYLASLPPPGCVAEGLGKGRV